MAIRYYKLFDLLNRRNMKISELRKIISSATIAKINKHEYVSGETIDKICDYLECQPGDIMEYVSIVFDKNDGEEKEMAPYFETTDNGEVELINLNIYPNLKK